VVALPLTRPAGSEQRRAFGRAAAEVQQLHTGEDALYRDAWVGLIGEAGSGKESLLSGVMPARPGSPDAFGLEGEAPTRWWILNDAVVVDFSADFFAPGERSDSGARPALGRFLGAPKSGWQDALEALRSERPLRPLDSVVLTVALPSLRARSIEESTLLAQRAEALAERVREARRILGLRLPIYVVVTGCEAMPGFVELIAGAPREAHDQMFGWSSPYGPDQQYAPSWVDQAAEAMHETMCRVQLELLPKVTQQAARDALYLLPREINALRAPLKAYLDPLLRDSMRQGGLPLRGIYLIAEQTEPLDPARPDLLPARKQIFVRHLFQQKIFPEVGLGRVDDDFGRKARKDVLGWRIAAFAVIAAAVLAVVLQSHATNANVETFNQRLGAIFDEFAVPRVEESRDQARRPRAILEALSGLDLDRLWLITAPTTAWHGLDGDVQAALDKVVAAWLGRPLRGDLLHKGKELVAAPPTHQAATPSPRVPLANRIAAMRAAVGEIAGLRASVQRYNEPSADNLVRLYTFLYGQMPEGSVDSKSKLYRSALANARGEPIDFGVEFRASAEARINALTREFQQAVFSDHPLPAELVGLATELDGITEPRAGVSELQRIEALDAELTRIQTLLADEVGTMLVQEKFAAGTEYDALIADLDALGRGGETPAGQDAAATDPNGLGQTFAAINQTQFARLRAAVLAQSSTLGGKTQLVSVADKALVFNGPLAAIRQSVDELLRGQPYVIQDAERPSAHEAWGRKAGANAVWNAELLAEMRTFDKKLVAFLEAERPALPDTFKLVLDTAANRAYIDYAEQVLGYAMPPLPTEVTVWSPQRRQALRDEVNNLASQAPTIFEVIDSLTRISEELADEDSNATTRERLVEHAFQCATTLLGQVDDLLTGEKLYSVRSDPFSWLEGDQPPGVVAFGARDRTDLKARLDTQRATLSELAMKYALPVVDVLTGFGDRAADDEKVGRWQKIIEVMRDYDKKVAGNDLEKLERFVEVDLNNVQLSECAEVLEAEATRDKRDSFFLRKKYDAAMILVQRCRDLLDRVRVLGYQDLQNGFRDTLHGRFPFAGPDVEVEAETGQVAEFFKNYEQFMARAHRVLKAQSAGSGPRALFGAATAEVLHFLDQVDRLKPMFASMLTAEGENPDLALTAEFQFRVNRDNEVNGNQIIEWWAQVGEDRIELGGPKSSIEWRTNMPVQMCFRWAKNADFAPGADQRDEHARVNGLGVCYQFEGRWALLRLLAAHAATPVDRGKRSFLEAHTLRFQIATESISGQRSVAGVPVPDTRVYVRVGLKLPEGKAAIRLPDFPRKGPTLPEEFLRSVRSK